MRASFQVLCLPVLVRITVMDWLGVASSVGGLVFGLGGLVVAVLARRDAKLVQRTAQEANRISEEANRAVSVANRLAAQANEVSREANLIAQRAFQAANDPTDFVWRLQSEQAGRLLVLHNDSSFNANNVSVNVARGDKAVLVCEGLSVAPFSQISLSSDLLAEWLSEVFNTPTHMGWSIDGYSPMALPGGVDCLVHVRAVSDAGVHRVSVVEHRFTKD